MSELKFKISNNGIIKIDSAVFEKMRLYVQREPTSLEGGGVLLGRLIKESKDIIIDKISVPMIGDKRTRLSFHRGAKMHQRVIDFAWGKSQGTCNYLGEWHTHPENYPSPSSQDINDWKRKLKHDSFSTRYLFFIIAGIKELCMWEGDRRTLKIKKLNTI